MQVALITLSTVLLLTGPQPARGKEAHRESYTVDNCRITLIEDVDVPAQEAGVLRELNILVPDAAGNLVPQLVPDAAGNLVPQEVREGMEVSEDQVLGQIDDRMEAKLKKVAEYKLQVADIQAANDINVQYAKAATDVAAAEVKQAQEANLMTPGTVPPAQFLRMLLAHRQAELQIEQSEHDLEIDKVSVLVRQAEDEVADLQLDRRRITAPLDGVIVKRYVNVGEWVRPGEPVLRIIRINRVRVEGFVDASQVLRPEIEGQEVTVRFNTGRRGPRSAGDIEGPIEGRVVFASPIVEAGRFLVQAEVDNEWVPDPALPRGGYWLLRSGLTVDMDISLNRIEPPTQTARAQRP